MRAGFVAGCPVMTASNRFSSARAPSIRLHMDHALRGGEHLTLDTARAHYLGTVMRRGVGDALSLFNATDGEWRAVIERIDRKGATLSLTEQIRSPAPEEGPWLVFALLKRTNTELVVQKATELGVSRLIPVMTTRTNAERINAARLEAIAVEAAEQCERLTIPVLQAPQPLPALLCDWPEDRRLYAAIERSDAAHARGVAGPSALLTGPEGGFSEQELVMLRSHARVIPVSLGRAVLRAETAAIAGLALLTAPPVSDMPIE
ncbi:surface protein [Granulibacter bethesdensis]|uniref:Ribosomal RNA small subunit methyltransferase E n=2 Tax=Granulibacter bethesdensis TaxID=364410 RepID=A0AAN0RFL5_9PROT|nr:surface protein [Granulibacter bethesdensis]APH60533.1 surface protein [Granulibacter bethesdensis]